MVSLLFVFYLFVTLFSIIGSMRGWAKELLVIFSVILGLAFISVLENLIPFTKDLFAAGSVERFWVRTVIVILLVFFGYQSPKLTQLSRGSERREQIQEVLLGLFFGLISGYMIVGTIWSFMDTANYPFKPYISSPDNDPIFGNAAKNLLNWLPPMTAFGQHPWIYIVVVLSFIFVMVVFL